MSKRARAADYSAEEKNVIINMFVQYHHKLDGSFSNDLTNQDKKKIKIDIVEAVNAVSTTERTWDSINDKWSKLKRDVKSKAAKHFRDTAKEMGKTGGGDFIGEDDSNLEFLSEFEQRIYHCIPVEQVKGIDGGFACSSSALNVPSVSEFGVEESTINRPEMPASRTVTPVSETTSLTEEEQPSTPLAQNACTKTCQKSSKPSNSRKRLVAPESDESAHEITSSEYYRRMLDIEQQKLNLGQQTFQLRKWYYEQKLKALSSKSVPHTSSTSSENEYQLTELTPVQPLDFSKTY